jgi:hypothetical protein
MFINQGAIKSYAGLLLFFMLSLQGLTPAQQFSYTYKLENGASQAQGSNEVEKILIVKDTIWLATSKGLSKSEDYGQTWINYYRHESFGEEGISAIAYHNGTIWAATWHLEDAAGSSVPFGTGLRYSRDGGKTWVTVEQPVDDPGDSSVTYGINTLRALPVTVGHNNFVYDIAFTGNTVWIACFAGGLRKSDDMGKTWKRVVLPPDYLDSIKPSDQLNFSLQPVAGKFGSESYLNHRVFSLLALDDSTIYVGTAGGINKSVDGGLSWTKFNHTNQSKPISGDFILELAHNRADNSIWAATWRAEGSSEYYGLSVSFDGEKNWETYLVDHKVLGIDFKYYNNGSYDVFAATEDGLFRSDDRLNNWIAAPRIYDSNTGVGTNYITRRFRCVNVYQKNNNTDVWIGSLDGLIKYNDADNNWGGNWKVFIASQKLESDNSTYAFPNPFSPDNEIVRIKYNLTKPAEVTIRIFDFGMNLVKTLIQNAPRNLQGDQFEVWNGRDEAGNFVPNGVYFYRIDKGGDGEPLFGKIMVLR